MTWFTLAQAAQNQSGDGGACMIIAVVVTILAVVYVLKHQGKMEEWDQGD